jgi:hypothetical protein
VPAVPDKEEEGTVAEEKLVHGVVEILPGKVPAVETHRDIFFFRVN